MMMAERPKLLYIIVRDVESEESLSEKQQEEEGLRRRRRNHSSSFGSLRYTRPVLQSTLQLIGCKTRHAFKISKRVFEVLVQDKNESTLTDFKEGEFSKRDYFSRHLSDSDIDNARDYSPEEIKKTAEENEIQLKEITKKLYDVKKRRCTLVLNRAYFMNVVCDAMSEYRYFGPNQRLDFALACKIREKRTSVTILLCGTSGCGKSTLSALLASRLGITTVVSTDSIRHMMRSFVDERENPLLYASTYSAGEHLDPAAVAEAKMKKLAKKMSGKGNHNGWQPEKESPSTMNADLDLKGKSRINESGNVFSAGEAIVSAKTMAIEGYKAQSEMVIDSLDRTISSWEQKCESVIVEGVHLSLDFVIELMKKHPTIIPFMIYIANEEKHLERFAVRAKYMTLDPAKNKYVKYIRNIRAIQDYQCKKADKYAIPKVNNTNMDQSVASIHATIFACLRRNEGGEPYYDEVSNTVKMVDDEYKNQRAANSLGSKGMLQIIHRSGSSRHLMALLNTDGSIAKTWAVDMNQAKGKKPTINDSESENVCSYEPLEVRPVNLQFGNFGLSAWQNDTGGTSHGDSIDGLSSKGDIHEYPGSHRSSRYGSCSSSPRLHEGTEKELVLDNRASGSDDEHDMIEFDSEEENQDTDQQLEAEVEGSVTAGSIASDEEEDYNVTTDQEEYAVDSIEASPTGPTRTSIVYKSCLGNGGVCLTESGRSNFLDEISAKACEGFADEFPTSGEYRKLLHGRSKSLSITPYHGSYQLRRNE